jgi:hypothetical protein
VCANCYKKIEEAMKRVNRWGPFVWFVVVLGGNTLMVKMEITLLLKPFQLFHNILWLATCIGFGILAAECERAYEHYVFWSLERDYLRKDKHL